MRDYSITRKKGELYHAKVTDSYGKKYQNYFETADKASEWIYYIWDKEDWFNSVYSSLYCMYCYSNYRTRNIITI